MECPEKAGGSPFSMEGRVSPTRPSPLAILKWWEKLQKWHLTSRELFLYSLYAPG